MVSSVLRWWRKHAGIRSVEATPQEANPLGAEEQFRKAIEYANGEGVVQDYAQAAQWYTQAAEQNHSPAQLKLAMLYRRGLGVPQDKAKSLLWLTRAANLVIAPPATAELGATQES